MEKARNQTDTRTDRKDRAEQGSGAIKKRKGIASGEGNGKEPGENDEGYEENKVKTTRREVSSETEDRNEAKCEEFQKIEKEGFNVDNFQCDRRTPFHTPDSGGRVHQA